MKKLFNRSDVDAALGVFIDGFIKVVAGSAILINVVGFSKDTVYKNVIPALGLFAALYGFYLFAEGFFLSKKDGNATAIPGGVTSARFFIWLFAVMGPVYWQTKDAILAWHVGIWAQIIGSLVFFICAFITPYLIKVIPRAALFGAMAGGAMAWLLLATIGDIFTRPLVGFISLFIILVVYFGGFNLKLPAVVISMIFGTVISLVLGYIDFTAVKSSLQNASFNLPLPKLSFLNINALEYTFKNFMPIIIVFSFREVISAVEALAQARVGGDIYNERRVMLVSSVMSMLSGFFGNPFPLGPYWGHAGWKKINATPSYMLIVGALYLIFALTSLTTLVVSFVPMESILPVLVFVALVTIAQAYEVSDKKYYAALSLAMVLPVIEFVWIKATAAASLFEGYTLEMLSQKGVSLGYQAISQGSGLTAIIWGSIFCFVIDKKWKNASVVSFVAAVLVFFGIINSKTLGIFVSSEYMFIYLFIAAAFLFMHFKTGVSLFFRNK